jgi:hypothetical protein
LNLNAALFLSGGAGADGGTAQSAGCSTNRRTMAAAQRGAEASAERSAAYAFKQTGIISRFCLAADLAGGILFAAVLFHLELFERFPRRR